MNFCIGLLFIKVTWFSAFAFRAKQIFSQTILQHFFFLLFSSPTLEAIGKQSSRRMGKQILTLILNKPGIGIGFLKLSPRITLIPHARGNQKSHGEAFSPNIGNENFVFLKAKISSCLVLLSLSRDLWPQESCDSSTSFGRTTSVSSSFPVYWDPVLLLICASGTTKKKILHAFYLSFFHLQILRLVPRRAQTMAYLRFVENFPIIQRYYVVLFILCYCICILL